MSLTKFDNIVRSALWIAYNNKCFYCDRELNWPELNIDHIIPENLKSKPNEFERIKSEYELSDEFDINALYNLVPSHVKCNLRKSGNLFEKTTTLFYLNLTKTKLTKIEKEIDKIKNRKNKGLIISKLQTALSSNLIDATELQKILAESKKNNWNKMSVKLPHDLEFIDEVYNSFYLNMDYSSLYDKKMFETGIQMSKNDEIKYVKTFNEWKYFTDIGFIPVTNADLKSTSEFTFLEELFEALNQAQMPKISFVSEPWIELDNIDFLSPNLLHDSDGRLSKYADEGLSIGDLVKEGIIKKNDRGNYKISLEYDGMETSFIEQFRADFNEDGIEDIFVRGWSNAVMGTLGFGFTTILSRLSDKHLIEEIKI